MFHSKTELNFQEAHILAHIACRYRFLVSKSFPERTKHSSYSEKGPFCSSDLVEALLSEDGYENGMRGSEK